LHGGTGNDFLLADRGAEVWGDSGKDTFRLEYNSVPTFISADGAIVHDFTSGADHIVFSGHDPEAFLTNEGDLWTVHFFDDRLGQDNEITVEISDVTQLQPEDYSFLVV
jgi:Ca2+-binding RTX toxin-like protein